MSNQHTVVKCKRCRRHFSAKYALKRHYIKYRETCVGFYYTCKRCLNTFDDLDEMLEHQLESIKICSKYEFVNEIQQKNRVTTCHNINNFGFKEFLEKILTPVIVDKQTEKTELNFKMTKLIYDSLTNDEFKDFIQQACNSCPDLKCYLLVSLNKYIEFASQEKAQQINDFFTANRSTSFQ